jgi:hypothetical protein
VNFQVTVLKVLVSYPDGWASLADLKRDVAILATSGREWSERTSRLAAGIPGLEIFSQGLVERRDGGWRITSAGRTAVGMMETKQTAPEPPQAQSTAPEPSPIIGPLEAFAITRPNRRRLRGRRGHRGSKGQMLRANAS